MVLLFSRATIFVFSTSFVDSHVAPGIRTDCRTRQLAGGRIYAAGRNLHFRRMLVIERARERGAG
jgi:hypothetical protein